MDDSFFAAQRRHRRSARVFSALAVASSVASGVPFALMLAPFWIAAAVLSADVLNLLHPTANLGASLGDLYERGSPVDGQVTSASAAATRRLLLIICAAAVPGLAAMAVLWWSVRRFLLRDGLGGVLLAQGGRDADHRDDEEHQLANVVEEMALAAGIASPRVVVLPLMMPNAAMFGRSEDSSTIAVSRGLLDGLDRDATQGVAAHLVASVANGDLRLRHSLLAVFVANALSVDLLSAPFAKSSRRRLGRFRRLMRRGEGSLAEGQAIRELLRSNEDGDNWAVGFLFLAWQVTFFYTSVFTGPLLALPFRARRYLADATAVQLTRSPDGLGRALIHLDRHARPLPGAGLASMYMLTASGTEAGGESEDDSDVMMSSLHPALHKRVERLRRLGFTGRLERHRPRAAGRDWPLPVRWLATAAGIVVFFVVLVPLVLLLVVVLLGAIALGVMLGFFFFVLIVSVVALPLHWLLRWLA